MEKAASFLSFLIGGGGGGVHGHLFAPGRYRLHWVQVGSAVDGGEPQRESLHPDQRVEPKLALTEVEMPPGAFTEDWQPTPNSHMVIRAPGMVPLKILLVAERSIVDVWEWSGSAYDGGAEAAEWFSTYFGKPSRLVRFKEALEIRPTDPNYAQGYKVMFADGYPFLMPSQGSLDALNEILTEPIPMNRFRPNISVDGCHPYSEDLWKTMKINNLTFQSVKLCDRCKFHRFFFYLGIRLPPTDPGPLGSFSLNL